MSTYLVRPTTPFGPGYSPLTAAGEPVADTGMNFGILNLHAGARFDVSDPSARREGALLLLAGRVRFTWTGGAAVATRESLFDEAPTALHYAAGEAAQLEALSDCELALTETPSEGRFETKLFDGSNLLDSEHRGQGQLEDTAHRLVRTIFDRRNRPESALVLGEVVNFPGRWSSYPPHHHPQPEIYHYRFSAPQGYGHAELGDEVLKVRHGDTVKILDRKDHAQTAAPGYGMYYLWAIRHLPGDPYVAPEFALEHRWLLDPAAAVWTPKGARS